MPLMPLTDLLLAYETYGDPQDTALVLIMGLGAARVFWETRLCEQLARQGFYVVRFDNRDIGQSSWFSHHRPPSLTRIAGALMIGQPLAVPYTLDAMADDTIALMDGLGIHRAVLCGVSMGGMIAQTIAIRYPERVIGLASISSTTSEPGLPGARPQALAALLSPFKPSREGFVAHGLRLWRTIGSPAWPTHEPRMTILLQEAWALGVSPEGVTRQFTAILAHGSRRRGLQAVRVPAYVLHGEADTLIPPECGRATASAISGAKWEVVPGMGHDLPEPVWPRLMAGLRAIAGRPRV